MGPADKTNASSAYVRHIVGQRRLAGQLIQALKDEGVWNNTYLVITADHGMGTTAPARTRRQPPARGTSSWRFYGPDLKKGATIPYAELPDVAVTAMRFLGLPPLKGHTAPSVDAGPEGPDRHGADQPVRGRARRGRRIRATSTSI